ncbi:SusC/RagA family TonB-linked outer membrane protein [Chitinophaga pinensis]|nr:SusC/RagA family TonB-linked outer membrane protein [Chitinophaga pinensis]
MSVFLLWFSFSAFSEIDQTGKQKVTVIAKNETLESVFKQIEKQTGLRFMYSTDAVNVNEIVSVEFEKMMLDDVLRETLGRRGIRWVYRQHIVSLISLDTQFTTKHSTSDKYVNVSGKIIDNKGNPIPGATILIKGSNKGTKSDSDGSFLLVGVSDNSMLIVRHIGFGYKEVEVTQKTLIIRLDELPGVLDETVVVGYGIITPRFNTGNVISIKSDEIARSPVSDPLLALQGKVPGMVITQTTGLSGGQVKVQIRGQNSLKNGTIPLFIVDGVPYQPVVSAPVGGTYGALGTVISALNFINPRDIESIDVLKDADATSIYGARGANGVVLITTKKGRIGETKIDVSLNRGLQNLPRKRKLLDTQQYLDMRREAFRNDDMAPSLQNAPDLILWDTASYVDWQKELLGRTASYTDGQLSFSGGVSSVQYLLGGNFHRETTIFPGDFSSNRGGVHFNITGNSPDQRLRASITGNYTIDKTNFPGFDFATKISLPPNAPSGYNLDGTLNWANSTWDNPYAQLMTNMVDGKVNNLVGNIDLSYRVIEGLVLKANLGYTETRNNTFSAYLIAGLPPEQASTATASGAYTDVKSTNWITEPQLTFHRSLGKSQINILLGATLLGSSSDGKLLYTDGILQDALVRYPGAAKSYTISGIGRKYKYLAFFGRFGYNLRDKYIINFTLRRDGSSRFGPRNQFSNFGSLGIGWLFSEESLIKENFSILSFGKLRGSYGITGNDQIGDYQYLDQYKFVENLYQGEKGLRVQGLYNPDFAWERTRKTEIALELGFLKDKILINSSYYNNYSNNQLLSYDVPIISGASTLTGNLPIAIRNSGIELVLTSQNVKSQKIEWATSINFSRSRNKLVTDYQNILGTKRIGRPLSEILTYKSLGVNEETGAYQFANSEGKPVDAIDADGGYSLINPAIDFFGGIQNNIKIKQFQIDVFFQFTKQVGRNSEYDPNWIPGEIRNQPQSIVNRWRKPGDVAVFQKVSQNLALYDNYAFWVRASNSGYADASFLRCKNVMLSWLMPEKLLNNLHLKMCRIYIQGQNLFTITKYKGWDPETQSVDVIPPLRVLNAGFQMSF